jgi:hypothetical protein
LFHSENGYVHSNLNDKRQIFVCLYKQTDMAPFHLNNISLNHLSFQIDNAGLLKVGVPKTWKESKQDLHYIRKAGIRQFVSTYNRVKDLKGDELLWGDEIEYGIFHIDPETKKIRLSLRAKTVSKICCGTSSRKEWQ